jgi:hypothetical protein
MASVGSCGREKGVPVNRLFSGRAPRACSHCCGDLTLERRWLIHLYACVECGRVEAALAAPELLHGTGNAGSLNRSSQIAAFAEAPLARLEVNT